MATITLAGNYGYAYYRVYDLASGTIIDATTASWIVDNDGSPQIPYPFRVYNSPNLLIKGGSIWGTINQTMDWEDVYALGNSAALRLETCPNVVIDDWRIDKAWDAFRIALGSTNFLIDDAYVTNNRDDAVEDDYVMDGTIRDSLFDGTFSGLSLGDANNYDGSGNTMMLEGVFMRMQSYLFRGEVTHVSPFKMNTGAPATSPDIRIINSVIAVSDPNHESQARLQLAWDHLVESHGNVYLNLSDTPLPSSYPLPPYGFTVLQGQAARDYWAACVVAWQDNHDGTPYADVTPLPPPLWRSAASASATSTASASACP